jgi:hypothetical protein
MSAVLATPWVIGTATAVAEETLPVWRAKPIIGYALYRKYTLALLRRYMETSMEIGRAPCVLGKMMFRGRVSSYRLRTFEDSLIFVLDVEKCLKQLDNISQTTVAHVGLEDYSIPEAATFMGESMRSINRIYGAAMDRLTQLFLEFGLLDPNVENLSRGEAKIQSNDPT